MLESPFLSLSVDEAMSEFSKNALFICENGPSAMWKIILEKSVIVEGWRIQLCISLFLLVNHIASVVSLVRKKGGFKFFDVLMIIVFEFLNIFS